MGIAPQRHGGSARIQIIGHRVIIGGLMDDVVHHFIQLVSQEDGDNGGRCFLGAQAQVVAHIAGAVAQQIGMGIHRLHNAGQHQLEAQVVHGIVAGIQQIGAGIAA